MMIRQFAVLTGLLILATQTFAQSPIHGNQDGLETQLTIGNQMAHVAWRFGQSLPQPLREVVASYNGRLMTIGKAVGYPRPSDRTAVMFLVDITGGQARQDAVYLAKARLLRLYDSLRQHHQVALGVIDGDTKIVMPEANQAPDPLAAMLQLKLSDAGPDLGGAIEVAIEALGSAPVARKAVYILTDGASEKPYDANALIAAARKSGVSVNLLIDRSARPANLEELRKISAQSDGIFAEAAAVKTVIDKPFLYLDSGGFVDVDLNQAIHYPWEDQSRLTVSLLYGDKRMDLVDNIEARNATMNESVRYLWSNHGREIAVGGAAIGWTLVLGGILVSGVYRRRTKRPAHKTMAASQEVGHGHASEDGMHDATSGTIITSGEEAGPPSIGHPDATAETAALTGPPMLRLSMGDGTGLDRTLTGGMITIGRAAGNDIQLNDPTVSSRQARIIENGRGGYALENLSRTNPTRINGERHLQCDLKDGDRIAFGEVVALFSTETEKKT